MDWTDTIREGMKMIIRGCKQNTEWTKCRNCPFDELCTSIYKDESHPFSTPDTWDEEGLWDSEENENGN